MSFLTRDAALMPEQRGSIALDRGERAAQFMAHCSQQFRLEQLHLLERSVFQSRFQFVDTSGQQDVHEHSSNCLRNKWQDGTSFLSSRKRVLSINLPSPAQQH